MNVLIVDDNAQVRRVIRASIEDYVEGIVECESGEEAVNGYAQFQPDWILMDLQMAGGDGVTATCILKTMFPEARVVIVTSHDSAPLRKAAATAGAHAYVLKEDLYQLRTILSQSA